MDRSKTIGRSEDSYTLKNKININMITNIETDEE
jgi:hypothetical protein